MKERINLDLNHIEKSARVFKALSLPIRLRMLQEMVQGEQSMNISELAERLELPLSSAALHVRVLEKAGILILQEKPGQRGAQKICTIITDDVYFNLAQQQKHKNPVRNIGLSMPVGNYTNFSVTKSCGLASRHSFIGNLDSPDSFYDSNHYQAQILWFTTGFIEYHFSNYALKNEKLLELSFSLEACSEAPGYNNDWPSDITIWINNEEVFRFHSTGDFGGKRGLNNPDWWANTMSQYGELHLLEINATGCYSDGRKTSDHTLASLDVTKGSHISFKIGVKEDAKYVGGVCLFGEHFGNYSSNIEMGAKLVM
ncbi:MAG: helix-turn-helix domain-containing protein [Treponema sp.]|jgi:predicted transcriptional regulator|nr:helix-turn-helix domain-containing protein [Treponema sp.]